MESLHGAMPTGGTAGLYPADAHPASSASGWDQAVADAHVDVGTSLDASSPHARLVAGGPDDGGTLARTWQWTKQEASSAGHAIGEFDSHHHNVLTRAAGVAQAVAARRRR